MTCMSLHPRELLPTSVNMISIFGRHGFVVAITGIKNIGKGLIRDGTGFVSFPVKYQCVVFRPFKGEILEAVVTMVNKMGFFAEAGPVQIFVSNHVKIQKDSEVRLKIIGTRVDATEIIGTILSFQWKPRPSTALDVGWTPVLENYSSSSLSRP
ncbi:DNA-directed RNA polymerase II subunit RPB7 isoform X2 [Fagus crenata]